MNQSSFHANRHQRLADALREVVRKAESGSRLDSMEQLAARYGVSMVTVRLALSALQQEGWVELRHGSGCYIRRPAQSGTGRHIALLSEFNLLLSPRGPSFYSLVLNELRRFMKAHGQSVRLYIGEATSSDPEPEDLTCTEFLEDLALNRISGIVAIATLPFFSWKQRANNKGIPLIGMNGLTDRFDGVVNPDACGAIHDAVGRLAAQGRKRPAFIGWDPGSRHAFETTLTEAGLSPDPRWMRNGLQPLEPGSGWSDFREIWAGGKAKPDCILFGDDMLFQDACPAIQTCGARIPDELEIVVLSNKGMPLPQYVPFTRLDCDLAEVAGEMGTMLLQLTTGQTPANRSVDVPYRPAEREDEEQQTVAAHQGQEERESRSLL